MTMYKTLDAEFLIPLNKAVQDIFEEKRRLCNELKKLPEPRTREQNDTFNRAIEVIEGRFRDAMWSLSLELDIQLRKAYSHASFDFEV